MIRLENNNKDRLINAIIDLEWQFFDKVEALEGRATCQDDACTFYVMRYSQHHVFSEPTLKAYADDLKLAQEEGRNPITEKYAFMMEQSDPAYFKAHLATRLSQPSPVKRAAIEEIENLMDAFQKKAHQTYTSLKDHARPQETQKYDVSSLTYLTGELKTWSLKTLYSALKDLKEAKMRGQNPVLAIVEKTAWLYEESRVGTCNHQ